jgi:hypothetical protein
LTLSVAVGQPVDQQNTQKQHGNAFNIAHGKNLHTLSLDILIQHAPTILL